MGNDVDPRSDLFSLGSVMYFMATGREPFRAEKSWAVLQKIITGEPKSARTINSDVPTTLEGLIQRLMARDPERRFSSANEAQEVMQDYLAHLQNPKVHGLPKLERLGMNDKGQGRAFSWRRVAWATVALAISILVTVGTIDYLHVAQRRASQRANRAENSVTTRNVYRDAMPAQSIDATAYYQRPNSPANEFSNELRANRPYANQLGSSFSERDAVSVNDAAARVSFDTELRALAKDVKRLEMRLSE